jgi:hypothetical protein
MKPEFKPYLYSAIGFLLALYLLAFVFLALLTTINQAADYPLYNFLGSEQDLGQVVLRLLPAQNPYYLPKWNSLPALTMIISALLLVASVIVTFKFARQVRARGRIQALVFALFVLLLAILAYAEVFAAIAEFLFRLAPAG